ncbi:uncharacterized protein LOC141718511 [Apium graveolens]|uniref:uncharacterized protein LOC141718511 n=1 Tax=Apium graveolens TaxID=4045 RepID=UPI003D7B878E
MRGYQNTGRDRSTVRCFNCNVLGHYAAECKRPRREKSQRPEANLAQIKDDVPALLLAKVNDNKVNMVLLNEENIRPTLERTYEKKRMSQICNILSLGQMSEQGNRVVVQEEYLWVYDSDDRLLMKVKRSANRLYKIMLEESQGVCLLTKTEENSWLWHSRLGHVNFDAPSHMERNSMAIGLPKLVHPKEVCWGA